VNHKFSWQRSRGFALLIVLWAIVLAALLGSQVTALGRRETKIAANLRASAVAEAAADGAIREAIFRLIRNEPGWYGDGQVHRLFIGQVTVDLVIHDERGKIDLNGAPPKLLTALLQVLGLPEKIAPDQAAAILAWRGLSFNGNTLNAAEQAGWSARYRGERLDYDPPFKVYETVDELALVVGMTSDLFQQIESHVTLFGGGSPDTSLADPVVMAAIQIAELGSSETAATPPQPVQSSGVVTVDAEAVGPEGGTFARRALVRLGAGLDGYSIYSWRRVPSGL
jgi:general secretion pathway protein K